MIDEPAPDADQEEPREKRDWLSGRKGAIGTFWLRRTLDAAGHHRRSIERELDKGSLIRVRRGLYASPDAHPDAVAVLRQGARLACATTAAAWGLWVRDESVLHADCGRRGPEGGRFRAHWGELRYPREATAVSVGLRDALRTVLTCLPRVEAIAVLDSALHKGVITEAGMDALFATMPAVYRPLRRALDGLAESGLESALRCIVSGLGLPYRSQVPVDGVGRFDGLVGSWLALEADGREFHGKGERDYERDVRAARLGIQTLRFTSDMVWERPAEVGDAIAATWLRGPRP